MPFSIRLTQLLRCALVCSSLNTLILKDRFNSKSPLFSFVSPTLCFLVWLSDAFVEHFSQVWYTCVWTIVVLVFQTMTTLRKDSPLSIQEDASMHSALSFHRRKCLNTTLECRLNINAVIQLWHTWAFEGLFSFPSSCLVQTSGYLFRREAWQCALLGKGRTPQAVAPANEDQERIYSLWAHWHQHSIITGKQP